MQNIVLRPYRNDDQEALVKHLNNRKIWDNVRDVVPFPYTPDDADWWINHNLQQVGTPENLAIDLNGALIGAVGLILGNDVHRINAEIGYWLSENYWNQGIMPDILAKMVNYTFENFPAIQRIFAGVFEYNLASMKVLEKAGFHLEAIHRKAIIKNEKIWDEYLYVLSREL